MPKREVDGVALREAVEEFGSLKDAIGALQRQKQSLQSEVAELSSRKAKEGRERQELLAKLRTLRERTEKAKDDVEEVEDKKTRRQRQWDLFESLIGMMITSPSKDTPVEDLASWLEKVAEKRWRTSKKIEDLRSLFVQVVLGDYLRCFRCKSCGAKFVVNQKSDRAWEKYDCPACIWGRVEPDDTFIEALLSPEQIERVTREVQVRELEEQNQQLQERIEQLEEAQRRSSDMATIARNISPEQARAVLERWASSR